MSLTRGRKRATADPTAATPSVQDYLVAIYDLGRSGHPVIGARLARQVGLSAPSVSEAIQRLARAGYLRVGRGKRLRLTARGRGMAMAMVRRRRLLEQWLTEMLGLDAAEAHDEAHRLEHALSPRVERRLAESLGLTDGCPG